MHLEPFDVLDAGRMTVAADPSGAIFGVWQAREHIGAQLAKEPGTLNWAEVQTHDRAAAQPFYERVFGYTTETIDMGGDEYVVFSVEDTPVAGLVQIRADWGEMPSNWSAVFQVGDCDAAVAPCRRRAERSTTGLPSSRERAASRWSPTRGEPPSR